MSQPTARVVAYPLLLVAVGVATPYTDGITFLVVFLAVVAVFEVGFVAFRR